MSFQGVVVCRCSSEWGKVTESNVRVGFGVDWDVTCMSFDDARGILTIVSREDRFPMHTWFEGEGERLESFILISFV